MRMKLGVYEEIQLWKQVIGCVFFSESLKTEEDERWDIRAAARSEIVERDHWL